jgi:hypothetical protein
MIYIYNNIYNFEDIFIGKINNKNYKEDVQKTTLFSR